MRRSTHSSILAGWRSDGPAGARPGSRCRSSASGCSPHATARAAPGRPRDGEFAPAPRRPRRPHRRRAPRPARRPRRRRSVGLRGRASCRKFLRQAGHSRRTQRRPHDGGCSGGRGRPCPPAPRSRQARCSRRLSARWHRCAGRRCAGRTRDRRGADPEPRSVDAVAGASSPMCRCISYRENCPPHVRARRRRSRPPPDGSPCRGGSGGRRRSRATSR